MTPAGTGFLAIKTTEVVASVFATQFLRRLMCFGGGEAQECTVGGRARFGCGGVVRDVYPHSIVGFEKADGLRPRNAGDTIERREKETSGLRVWRHRRELRETVKARG